VPELGRAKPATNEKARRVLGWNPRSKEDALAATGQSLVRLRVVG
jgi:dihydroflavonol-4-reductase